MADAKVAARAFRWPRGRDLLVWLVVPATAEVVLLAPRLSALFELQRLIAGLLGLALVIVAARRPDRAIAALFIVLPIQLFLSAWLFELGVPLQVVKAAGYWKEAMVAGILVAGWRSWSSGERRLDTLDKFALGFVALAALYAALPSIVDAPTNLTVRYSAFRQMAMFLLLMLACRHLRLPHQTVRRLARLAVAVAVFTAAIALFEVMFSDTWNRFVVRTIRLPRWMSAIGTPYSNPGDIRAYSTLGGRQILRPGSVFTSLHFVSFLLLPLALLLSRYLRPAARSRVPLLTGIVLSALLLTQTRNTIFAALVIIVMTFWPSSRSPVNGAKARLALLTLAGLILVLPLAAASGLGGRFGAIFTDEDQSSTLHRTSIQEGWEKLLDRPFGHGLGTSQGTGQQFGTAVVGADNNFLHVGDELGVLGALLYIVITVFLVPRRLKATGGRAATLEMTAVRNTLIGVSLASFFHQPWLDLAVAWTFWCLAGAALSQADWATKRAALSAQPAAAL